jgi:hypothetical protein
MGPKPFARLATPRVVERADFPPDLAAFYSANEAVTFEGFDYGSLYLYPLAAVQRVSWSDVDWHDTPEGWEAFDALLIGGGCHGESIVSVLSAPCCPAGAILALGGQLDWNGGAGPFTYQLSLVLGASLSEWLRHLERFDWWEYGVGFDIPSLPPARQQQLRAYYLALNPHVEWPEP